MWLDQRGSEVLERNECLRLLALGAGGIGRIGLMDAEGVVILPVNYRMLDSAILVQVGPGSLLDAARNHDIVAFEIDEADTAGGHAWSVFVRGLATVVEEDARPEAALPLVGVPLIPEPGSTFVGIRTAVLTGRRFSLQSWGRPAEAPGTPNGRRDLGRRQAGASPDRHRLLQGGDHEG